MVRVSNTSELTSISPATSLLALSRSSSANPLALKAVDLVEAREVMADDPAWAAVARTTEARRRTLAPRMTLTLSLVVAVAEVA